MPKSQWIKDSQEESKDEKPLWADNTKDFMPFNEEYNRVAFKDENMTIFPIRATSSENGQECFSFIGIPNNAPPKFIPSIARELGCIPHIHFKTLHRGRYVILENGNKISPEMVTEPQKQAQAFALIFLPD